MLIHQPPNSWNHGWLRPWILWQNNPAPSVSCFFHVLNPLDVYYVYDWHSVFASNISTRIPTVFGTAPFQKITILLLLLKSLGISHIFCGSTSHLCSWTRLRSRDEASQNQHVSSRGGCQKGLRKWENWETQPDWAFDFPASNCGLIWLNPQKHWEFMVIHPGKPPGIQATWRFGDLGMMINTMTLPIFLEIRHDLKLFAAGSPKKRGHPILLQV